ncbi:putative norepinephrine/norepinephrine transporter [Schistosoma mansoni]|uniref:putative norepinephrine/norepinephrine transporter n=1 Tax=Schistosoma mansoni TaxID=6183 RepID=UPI00022DC75D|nr:putative norepinephrine/norepinephrine transporter [Schistosoma mansoni]|eukprot:XP_018650338.1 putative norepinephrine/norepinephrine transporter [Schistosoma mansoni]
MAVFTIVYFSLWKGVKSSGKAVWVTATLPYVILSILLIRGLTLEGSLTGIKYYLTPNFSSLLSISVWSDAASQIFFSLGPGFGVLLALSSYNKFHNNCYRFGGLEAIITAIMDSVPALSGRREVFVLAVVIYCFIGALPSTTCGGYLVLTMLDRHGAPISILFIVFCECVALCWFYGTKRFCNDVQMMLGFKPGIFWQICWAYISPIFLLGIFIANIVSYETQPVSVLGVVYEPTTWVIVLSWAIVFSSPIFIPILMIYKLLKAKGTFVEIIYRDYVFL